MSEKKSSVESLALSPVPQEARKKWLDVAFIQAGVVICVPSLMLGRCWSAECPPGTPFCPA